MADAIETISCAINLAVSFLVIAYLLPLMVAAEFGVVGIVAAAAGIAAQVDWNIEKEQSSTNILPIMQTDILLTIGERTLIIDTKYYTRTMQKQFDKSTIHSNNLFQIHTYVTEYDEDHTGKVDGMLLYAKTQEDIVPDGQMKRKDGNFIYFKTLDLNNDFEGIKERLDSFIK